MGKKLGNDYRLWVESAVAGTYNEVLGNQNLSISRSGGSFSMGTKSDFPYDPQAPSGRTVTLSGSFIPDLPDADGYGRLMAVARSTTVAPLGIQIRKGGAAGVDPGDVVFECAMHVTQDDNDMNQNAGVGAALAFVASAVPTVDTLS